MEQDIFFFGCIGEAGHYLWSMNGRRPSSIAYCPFNEAQLDNGPLLPQPEKKLNASIVHLHAWTVVSWWGSPWDSRGLVNNAIILKGTHTFDEVWERFQASLVIAFPLLKSLSKPTLVGTDPLKELRQRNEYLKWKYNVEEICRWLEREGFLDADWYAEHPTAVERYEEYIGLMEAQARTDAQGVSSDGGHRE